MNIDQVHNPARLDGESQRAYRERQKLSKRLATHMPVVHKGRTYIKPDTVTAQRQGAPK